MPANRWPWIFGGSDGPKHLYPDCPHVQRMDRAGKLRSWQLGPDSQLDSLIRCRRCRVRWLESLLQAK